MVNKIMKNAKNMVKKSELYDIDFEKYKKIYGEDFNPSISRKCEMANLWTKQGLSDDAVAAGHFLGGLKSFNRISEILFELGLGLENVTSMLDFASGFGRTNRFFVQAMGAEKITMSDITEEGVEFQKKTFGVKGFLSYKMPEDIKHDKTYQVVIANSLFSHFNHEFWPIWLEKLYSFVEDGGYLIFSTHGYSFFKKRDEEIRKKMILSSPEHGFYFLPANETLGRLEKDYYGTTYVIPKWVQDVVEKHKLGKIVKSYNPYHGFMSGQDVYVIQKV